MIRSLIIAGALALSVPAIACPMADAAAYKVASAEVQEAEGTKVSLKVDGMHCGDCSTKVTKALTDIDGVKAAAVDYQTGETVIAIDDSKTNSEALIKAIADTGFTATLNS